MPRFKHAGNDLHYEIYGEGSRNLVLMPGLLFPSRMHEPLATALADRGHRVITFDLLGHGDSDKPRDMWRYSMPIFGRQVVALLDHLEIDEAVIAGTSLGANVSLEVAAMAPERVRGLVVEMAVLDNALLACAIAFTPLMVALTFGEPVMRLLQQVARRVPTDDGPLLADLALDTIRQHPGPSAAVLQGLFFGRVAPPKAERRLVQAPALVIGHKRDPVHPFSDSDALVEELPNARLVRADSILELRTHPDRLTAEIADFLDSCWKPERRTGRAARTRVA
jgi:pimeloyl-ACP methyl ester carboxylesterase